MEMLPDMLSGLKSSSFEVLAPSEIDMVKGKFDDGKIDGHWKFYNDNGKKIAEIEYDHGVPVGTASVYHCEEKPSSWRWDYSLKTKPYWDKYYTELVIEFSNGQPAKIVRYSDLGDTLGFYQYKDGIPDFAELRRNDYGDYENQLNKKTPVTFTKSKYHYFENGNLSRISIDTCDKTSNARNEIATYTFRDGKFDGPYEYGAGSGIFRNNLFSGEIVKSTRDEKFQTQHFQNGLLCKEVISTADRVLCEITYDTSEYKLDGDIYRLYELSDMIEYPKRNESYAKWYEVTHGSFRSFHENGVIHAQGILFNIGDGAKLLEWEYYNPEGELVTSVNYDYDDLSVNGLEFETVGSLIQYENGVQRYKAAVIDIIEKYNCADADNYEIRQVVVLEDYTDGRTIPFPTRYHRTYYDNGVLQSEGNLTNGVPTGNWKFYDRNGGLSAAGNYENGLRHGRWLIGDLSGLAFIGDFCLNPDVYEFNPNIESELQKNLKVELVQYKNGDEVNKTELRAFVNQ
jgi:antitoxin component YwqK of YwqJK toxin-antitoxin module